MTNYPQRSRRANSDKQEVTNRDVNAAQRAVMAVQLRAQQLTYEEIAKRAGYSGPSACRKAIMRELDRVVVRNVDQLRIEELSMLNQMHNEVWQLFMDRKNKGRLFAVDRILAISERKAKLMGLDTPVDQAIAANMVVVREIPSGLLQVVEQVE